MYSKLYLDITMGTEEAPGERQNSLVYIDEKVRGAAPAPQEYIGRMNEAIEDVRGAGMPEGYIEKYLREYIPAFPAGDKTGEL